MKIFPFLAFALMASPLAATSWSFRSASFCKLHYTSTAYDKEVASVLAHVGMYMEKVSYTGMPSGEFYWYDVQDIPLSQSEQLEAPFTGDALIYGFGGKFLDNARYPVVQYFVAFTDGSSLVSEVYEMEVIREHYLDQRPVDWDAEIEDLRDELAHDLDDVVRTECVALKSVSIG